MVTPVISSIAPFDVSVGTVVNFTYTGGITNSYIEIFNIDNELIYDSHNDARVGISQLKQRVIPSATEVYVNENGEITSNPLRDLANNAQYYMRLTVENDGETAASQKKLFRCITTPTLSVYCNDGTNKPLGNSYTLETAAFELYADYTQAIVNGKIYEDLNSYQFILYDNNFQVIYTSDVYYNLLDGNNEHVYIRMNGLEQKRYFLKAIGRTVNGYLIDNDLITVDVEYKSNTQKTTLYVENCHEEGLIKIGTNIHALLYRLGNSPAAFVDDVIQLRDNWLEYYDGLTIDGDYVVYVKFKNPNYNTNLVRISGNGHNVYMNCYKHDTYMSLIELEEMYGDDLPDEEQIKSSYLYFDLIVDTNTTRVMITSDIFDVEKMKDAWFNAYIVRKGSTYSFLVLPEKYKMMYVLYDGTNDSRNPLNYQEGEKLYLYDPIKRGNTFNGWYTTSSFSSDDKITSPFITPDYAMTAYARWVANIYNISYNIPTGATHTNLNTYTYGTTTVLSDAEKTGYEFFGWYIDETYTNQITEIGNDEIDDKILYGKFEPKVYNMIYNLNGGENNAKNPGTYTTDAEVRLYDPTRNGYDFGGWYYDSSFNNPVNNPFIAPPSNTTVYAKWTAKTYNINYVDAVVENTNPTTYTYGTSFALKNLSRTGYTFDGWYLDEEYSEKVTSISSTTYGDLTLYAKWTVIYYTITYKTSYTDDVAGISITSDNGGNPTQYCVEDNITLLNGIINNDSYEFEGWYIGTSTSCDYSTKLETFDGSTRTGVLYLYPKIIAKEWFIYTCNDSTMTATLKFTNKATEMNEFYIPAEYNGYKVSNITLPVYNTNAPKLNTSSAFTVDENNEYYFSDNDGNMFYYDGSSLLMVWYNDSNPYCKESVFTNAMQKVSQDSLTITGCAFINHEGLEKIAICDNVYTTAPVVYNEYGGIQHVINAKSTTFKGCSNLTEVYFTCDASSTLSLSTRCASRAVYYSEKDSSGNYIKGAGVNGDTYAKYNTICLSQWQPTTSCTVYVKDPSVSVGIDSKQTISTDYNWELPNELK